MRVTETVRTGNKLTKLKTANGGFKRRELSHHEM